jgi:hypothetical protein
VNDKETERRAKLIELQKECLHAVTKTVSYGWITDRIYRCFPQVADPVCAMRQIS